MGQTETDQQWENNEPQQEGKDANFQFHNLYLCIQLCEDFQCTLLYTSLK